MARSRVAAVLFPLLLLGAMAGTLFGAAGRLDLPFFWAVIAIYAAFLLVGASAIDPDLKRERLRPGPGGADRHMRWLMLPVILAHWLVAGLDAGRFHWSGAVPGAVQAAGLAGLVLALGLTAWAMAVNRFFSPVVRIQSERGHRLVTAGPYRCVRHPGYAGGIAAGIGATLALGSLWALLPVAALVLALLRRTAIEDRFLRERLEGYAEYARRVRFKLIPGVW